MQCQYCQATCIKKGKYKQQQLYRCNTCLKYQREKYMKCGISLQKEAMIVHLSCEGMSISAISRILYISKSSVQRKLILAAERVKKPVYNETDQEYEMDELKTYIRNKEKECWVIYAINKSTRQVIDFTVGKRTTANVKKVVDAVLDLSPAKICTDRLNIYPKLVDRKIHCASDTRINHIERKNLELRKDIKCLNRRTICFAKSEAMLNAKLQLYFYRWSIA